VRAKARVRERAKARGNNPAPVDRIKPVETSLNTSFDRDYQGTGAPFFFMASSMISGLPRNSKCMVSCKRSRPNQ